ncbi:DUF3237 domain-containing protein [Hydrogenophaga flava]|uniref:DUF3237 domain-containing protein n=1 Tax=Hydrogenophaga flava TaxID=65657 RepID=UPI0008244040|nr:DUF3237 domain-containing protein [Hydrogenophaga flava]
MPTSSPTPTAPPAPEARFAWEAQVDIGERQSLGHGPLGESFIVPILGGRFEGPRLRGNVLPGGADRQLLRADGVKELDALYELQTDDGAVITVRNRVLIDESATPGRYARSVLQLSAPTGPHDWLNRRVFVGTLHSLRPARAAVCIRVYELA